MAFESVKSIVGTILKNDYVPEGRITEWYKKDGVHFIYCGEIIKVLKK